jgi:hypothetical protein
MIVYRVGYYWEWEGDFAVKYFQHSANATEYYHWLVEDVSDRDDFHPFMTPITTED